MKTKEKAIEGFKAVNFMREVRDQISIEIKDMNFVELKKYDDLDFITYRIHKHQGRYFIYKKNRL